jgi:enoyl-CoA hydratase
VPQFHAGDGYQAEPGVIVADEFNFVKARAEHGVKQAFKLRDKHFEVVEPEPQ